MSDSRSAPRRISFTCALVLVASACHGNAGQKESDAPAEPITVAVETVRRRAVADIVEAVGNLEPPPGADVRIGSMAVGILAEVLVSEGDHVRRGQLLARIDATPLRDAVRQAAAALNQSKVQEETSAAHLARTQRLTAKGIAARQETEDALAQQAAAVAAKRTAEASLSSAQSQLQRTILRAPFDGIVARVFVSAGEPTDGSGKPIVEVAQTRVVELRAGLAANQAVRVKPSARAEIKVDGLPDVIFPGRLVAIAPIIDPTTGVAIARIRIENPDGVLKGGAFARARIIANVHSDTLAVPKQALLPSDANGGSSVDVIEAGKARRHTVVLGYDDGRWSEVLGGLSEGQQVLIGGAYGLPDGTPVRAAAATEAGTSADGGTPAAEP